MHKDYYCAYHHSQIITSFCRCQDCLLPACSICMKLHSQEHALKKSRPDYQKYLQQICLTIIFKAINGQLKDIQHKTERLVKSLLVIQKNRKQQMKQIKQIISAKRSELVSSFQNCLRDLDQKIIKALYQLDNNFIFEIQQIDQEVLHLQRQIQKDLNGLQTQQSLKTLISYFQSNKYYNHQQNVRKLQDAINELNDKTISLKFGKQFNQQIKVMLENFVIIKQVSSSQK